MAVDALRIAYKIHLKVRIAKEEADNAINSIDTTDDIDSMCIIAHLAVDNIRIAYILSLEARTNVTDIAGAEYEKLVKASAIDASLRDDCICAKSIFDSALRVSNRMCKTTEEINDLVKAKHIEIDKRVAFRRSRLSFHEILCHYGDSCYNQICPFKHPHGINRHGLNFHRF